MDIEAQPFDLRECVESALDLVSARADREAARPRLRVRGRGAGRVERRRHAAAPDPAQPARQRGQVHRRRRGRAHRDAQRGADGSGRADLRGARHRHRPPPRAWAGCSSVSARSTLDHAQVRRHGAGPGDQQAAGRADGRQHVGRERGAGPGLDLPLHDRRAASPSCRAQSAATSSARSPQLQGKRVLIVDDNATNRRMLALQTAKWGMAPRDTESPREALRWVAAASASTSRSWTCTCREMDGLALARAIRARDPRRCRWCCSARSAGARSGDDRGAVRRLPGQADPPVAAVRHAGRRCSRTSTPPKPRPRRRKPQIDAGMAARHPLRILLAEDNVVNQKLALRLLQQMGYRADLASNGIEAVEAVERQAYDVVLMDVQMPEMDGLEAARRITARWPPRRAAAHRRDDRQRHAGRPRGVPRGRHGRLRHQADPRRPAGRGPEPRAAHARTAERSTDAMSTDPSAHRPRLRRAAGSAGADFVIELVDTFLEEAPLMLDELRAASGRRRRRAAFAARRIRSSRTASTFGALGLAALARDARARGPAPPPRRAATSRCSTIERAYDADRGRAAGARHG